MGSDFAMKRMLALLLLLAAVSGAAGEARADATADAHVAHITQNMPVGVWGWRFGPETLAVRMQRYHATAVRIAATNNTKTDWARGVGVPAPGGKTEASD